MFWGQIAILGSVLSGVHAMGPAPTLTTQYPGKSVMAAETTTSTPDLACAISVWSELMPKGPDNIAFVEWANSAGNDRLLDQGCTITAPASFSDELVTYYSRVGVWATTIRAAAAATTPPNCNVAGLPLTVSKVCTGSGQTVFWEENNTIAGVMTLKPVNFPTDPIFIGEANDRETRPSLVVTAVWGILITAILVL